MKDYQIYSVGDTHGCYDDLMKMMNLIYNDNDDSKAKIIFLGDYIDRGPDSKKVLDYLMGLKNDDQFTYIFLKGNHEDMLVEPQYYRDWLFNGGNATLRSFGKEVMNKGILPQEYMEWMKNLDLFHIDGRYCFVHAGIDPAFNDVEDNTEQTFLWSRNFVSYNDSYEGGWFVIHGHTPMKSIFVCKNQVNLDTGCVFGDEYRLSAMKIGKDDSHSFFQVKENKIFEPNIYDLTKDH